MADHVISIEELFNKVPEMRKVDLTLCVNCKSVKLACGLLRCPLLKLYEFPQTSESLQKLDSSNTLFGPSPQIFVGESGYPRVTAGPLTSLSPDSELSRLAGNPSKWTSLTLDQIMELRFGLLRGMQKAHALAPAYSDRQQQSRLVDNLQEIAMATNSVETETQYTGRIDPTIKLDSVLSPIGPTGAIRKLDVTGHSRIPNKVEQLIGDELKATEQVSQIASLGFDVYYLQNVFSSGLTGIKSSRKMVPTRWSITAVDDIVGNNLIQGLRDFKEIEDITVYHGGFYGNYFTFLLLPERWGFENFENWMKGSIYSLASKGYLISQDHEDLKYSSVYRGKSKYSNQAGGYYAARISLLYHLHKLRRQAKVISFREITPEYLVPSGVWVVREASRVALTAQPRTFQTREEAENYVDSVLLTPLQEYKNRSFLLVQRSLDEFFSD